MATLSQYFLSSIVAFILYRWVQFHRTKAKIDSIPTLGSNSFVGAYIDGWRFLFRGHEIVKEGYKKYHGNAFKISTPNTSSGWTIVVSGAALHDDLRKAPSEVLDMQATTTDVLQTEYLFGPHAHINEFQIAVVRTPMTRAMAGGFGELTDEIVDACSTYLPKGDDWEALPRTHEKLVHVICRTANRLFVGLPVCRDPEYLKVQEEWTVHTFLDATVLHLLPSFVKPVVGPLMSKIHPSLKTVTKVLGPIIQERIDKDAKYGSDWQGRPSDLISWLLDYAPPEYKTVEDMVVRIMFVNAAAIHTSTMGLSAVLFDLAAHREYIEPLRKEIEETVRKLGWTKEAMVQMHKLDSFIKESFRLSGMAGVTGLRKAMKEFTFSNGVKVPPGYTIGVASCGVHADPEIYEHPESFDGYRFFKSEETAWKNQAVVLDPTFVLFGLGRHACPGRFFAVNEVKAVVSHVLLNYDIKLPGDATQIMPGIWFASTRSPDPKAEILFRKRRLDGA